MIRLFTFILGLMTFGYGANATSKANFDSRYSNSYNEIILSNSAKECFEYQYNDGGMVFDDHLYFCTKYRISYFDPFLCTEECR